MCDSSDPSKAHGPRALLRDLLAPGLRTLTREDLPTVWIVEDDADLRQGLTYMLSRAYRVLVAEGAEQTLGTLAQSPGPDLLLVDYRLPDANGIELVQSLRDRGVLAPAIMLSAYGQRRDESLRAGFAAFVEKPWDDQDLVWRIESALRT